MEDDTRVEEEGGGGSLSLVVRPAPFLQPTRPSSQPAALLPANAALLHAVGPGAVPGVANSLLSLLQRWEERREQEERWCEGKSPGPADPTPARDPPPGRTNGAVSDPGPSPPQATQSVRWGPPRTKFSGVAGGLGGPEHRRGADLEEGRSGALEGWKLCKGDRNGH